MNKKEYSNDISLNINEKEYLFIKKHFRELYHFIFNKKQKSDINNLRIMIEDYHPNDVLLFNKNDLKNNPLYKELYYRHMNDKKHWNYYNVYLQIFCNREADPNNQDDINKSKNFDYKYTKLIDEIIALEEPDDKSIFIFRENNGLNDGIKKDYNQIALMLHTKLPENILRHICYNRLSLAKKGASYAYSRYANYEDPKPEDYSVTLNKCDKTLAKYKRH